MDYSTSTSSDQNDVINYTFQSPVYPDPYWQSGFPGLDTVTVAPSAQHMYWPYTWPTQTITVVPYPYFPKDSTRHQAAIEALFKILVDAGTLEESKEVARKALLEIMGVTDG